MPIQDPINPYKSYEVQTKVLQKAFQDVVTANEKAVIAMQKGIGSDYARMLKQLKEILSSAHSKYAVAGKLNWQELQRYNRIKTLEKNINEVIQDNYAPIKKRVIQDNKNIIENTYQGSVNIISAAAQVKLPTLKGYQINAILSKPISGWTLQERMALRVTDLGFRLNGSIKSGLQGDGITYKDQMKELDTLITKDYQKTGKLIEDMAHQHQSQAEQEAFDAAGEEGLQLFKEWVSAGDNRVRDSHVAMDGQQVDVADMFTFVEGDNKGAKTDMPGTSGIAGEDINCRCWMVVGIKIRDKE